METEVRICRICEASKGIDEFEDSDWHGDGKRTECRECRKDKARIARRLYYQKNKAQELAKKKKRDKENKEKIRAYQAEYRAKKKREKEQR